MPRRGSVLCTCRRTQQHARTQPTSGAWRSRCPLVRPSCKPHAWRTVLCGRTSSLCVLVSRRYFYCLTTTMVPTTIVPTTRTPPRTCLSRQEKQQISGQTKSTENTITTGARARHVPARRPSILTCCTRTRPSRGTWWPARKSYSSHHPNHPRHSTRIITLITLITDLHPHA